MAWIYGLEGLRRHSLQKHTGSKQRFNDVHIEGSVEIGYSREMNSCEYNCGVRRLPRIQHRQYPTWITIATLYCS